MRCLHCGKVILATAPRHEVLCVDPNLYLGLLVVILVLTDEHLGDVMVQTRARYCIVGNLCVCSRDGVRTQPDKSIQNTKWNFYGRL